MIEKNIIGALLKAQSELQTPQKKGDNPRFKSKYAKLDDIYSACEKALRDNDLIISHNVRKDENTFFLVTTAYHSSGESLSSEFPMILEQQTNQSMASARTYACRYGLCNLLAINFDEDDDGNATNPIGLDEIQVTTLEQILEPYPALKKRIIDGYSSVNKKIKALRDIPGKEFDKIVKNVQSRIEKGEGAA